MEAIFSVIMSELASRSMSFLVEKYLKQKRAPTEEKRLHILRRPLLRARVIVDEAEDRRITNQAMLHQLSILKKEMYRGYYILASFSCIVQGEEDRSKDHQVGYSFAPSKFNAAKRVRFSGSGGTSESTTLSELLEQVLGSLENTIEDAREFVMFLNGCPRLCRQPYSMYLMLDKSMFNRQMEMEHIISFLLQPEITPGAQDPGVLPIIGPGKVGKSTLIEHACDDQRVRNHFSQIVCFTEDDLRDASAVSLRDGGIIKHQNSGTDCGRTLIIIELVLDMDESVWKMLYSAAAACRNASGTKIIITSRSDSIARFGTRQALRVQFFTQEAYWYFFKVRAFGSADADDHPELTAIAMDMAREMEGCFMAAALMCELLKANLNPRFWSMALAILRNYKQKNLLLQGTRFVDFYQIVEPLYVRGVNRTSSEYIAILDHYQRGSAHRFLANSAPTSSAQSEPDAFEMSAHILFFGSVRPQGKFKVLAWRSHLPPHCDNVFTCEIRRQAIVHGSTGTCAFTRRVADDCQSV